MAYPELTTTQAELAFKLFTTEVFAKVTQMFPQPDGSRLLTDHNRWLKVIDFAKRPGEFAHVEHVLGLRTDLCPVQISLRNLPPDVLFQVGKSLSTLAIPDGIKFCVPIPRAGTALTEAYVQEKRAQGDDINRLDLLLKVDRTVVPNLAAPRGHGEPVVIVDDVFSRGGAKEQAFRGVQALGYEPALTLVLIDRDQGGPDEFLAKVGCPTLAFMRLLPTLQHAAQAGWISQDDFRRSEEYLLRRTA